MFVNNEPQCYSLREKFLQDLNKKLDEENFKQSEKELRNDIQKTIKSGQLF